MAERWKPNVTVAAVASRVRGGSATAGAEGGELEYLLVEEETAEGLRLNNPAGHLDPGESPVDAAVRETLEETARVFVPERFLGLYLTRFDRMAAGADVTYLRIAFAGQVGEADAARPLDRGIVRTLWMTLAELRACRERHRSSLLLRCVEDAAAGRSLPLDAIYTDPTVQAPPVRR
jgi:8-oxo-dGTP pyrophosphatase MutT (NUDIX family)